MKDFEENIHFSCGDKIFQVWKYELTFSIRISAFILYFNLQFRTSSHHLAYMSEQQWECPPAPLPPPIAAVATGHAGCCCSVTLITDHRDSGDRDSDNCSDTSTPAQPSQTQVSDMSSSPWVSPYSTWQGLFRVFKTWMLVKLTAKRIAVTQRPIPVTYMCLFSHSTLD